MFSQIHPPDGPFVFITNWQQFRHKSTAQNLWAQYTDEDVEKMPRGEIILDFLSQYPDLIVMNDEAHHVHGKKSTTGEELVWRQFMNIFYDRLKRNYENSWPIQIFDEGRMPEISQIDINSLPKYSGDFQQLKNWLSKLVVQETHVETGNKTKIRFLIHPQR